MRSLQSHQIVQKHSKSLHIFNTISQISKVRPYFCFGLTIHEFPGVSAQVTWEVESRGMSGPWIWCPVGQGLSLLQSGVLTDIVRCCFQLIWDQIGQVSQATPSGVLLWAGWCSGFFCASASWCQGWRPRAWRMLSQQHNERPGFAVCRWFGLFSQEIHYKWGIYVFFLGDFLKQNLFFRSWWTPTVKPIPWASTSAVGRPPLLPMSWRPH